MTDERVWLRHPPTGGVFHCPTPAAEAWTARGWEPGEPPEEPDATKDPEPTPPIPAVEPAELDPESTEDAVAAPEHEEN